MAYVLSLNDAHLVGKLLDAMDPLEMRSEGFSGHERERATALFNNLNIYLDANVGKDWDDKEVL